MLHSSHQPYTMSALDLVQISECLQLIKLRKHRGASATIEDLPLEVLALIMSYCDSASQLSASKAACCFAAACAELQPSQVGAMVCQSLLTLTVSF